MYPINVIRYINREIVCIDIANVYDSKPSKSFVNDTTIIMKVETMTRKPVKATLSFPPCSLFSDCVNIQLKKNTRARKNLDRTILLGNI